MTGMAVVLILVTVSTLLVCVYSRSHVLDRAGMENNPLLGTWLEIGKNGEGVIIIDKDTITCKNIWGENEKVKYTTKEHGDYTELVPEESGLFESLYFQGNEIEGRDIDILSGIIMEYDGRGPVVVAEFVQSSVYEDIPEEFQSQMYHNLNDREAVPTVQQPEE